MLLRDVRQLRAQRTAAELKTNVIEKFDNETKRMLEKKSKIFRWVVDNIPLLRDIERCCTDVADCRTDTIEVFKLMEASAPILIELSIL